MQSAAATAAAAAAVAGRLFPAIDNRVLEAAFMMMETIVRHEGEDLTNRKIAFLLMYRISRPTTDDLADPRAALCGIVNADASGMTRQLFLRAEELFDFDSNPVLATIVHGIASWLRSSAQPT